MDVYIDKQQRVWVVNVNPLDDEMNPGLFSVEEVRAMGEKSPFQFRVVEEEGHVLPSAAGRHASFSFRDSRGGVHP